MFSSFPAGMAAQHPLYFHYSIAFHTYVHTYVFICTVHIIWMQIKDQQLILWMCALQIQSWTPPLFRFHYNRRQCCCYCYCILLTVSLFTLEQLATRLPIRSFQDNKSTSIGQARFFIRLQTESERVERIRFIFVGVRPLLFLNHTYQYIHTYICM